jgi:4-hydroxy-3-polyprenylbenzoate decarboxylase
MQVPFASGSARFEAMVIVPCSMGMLGRIAHGYSDGTIARSADVFLKEKRKLIVVPRETPWNLVQARNVVTLLEAGAVILPAVPSFYGRPKSVEDVVDTVVARILDHLGVSNELATRWKSKAGEKE